MNLSKLSMGNKLGLSLIDYEVKEKNPGLFTVLEAKKIQQLTQIPMDMMDYGIVYKKHA